MYLHIPTLSTIMKQTLKATKTTSAMQVGEQIVRKKVKVCGGKRDTYRKITVLDILFTLT
jgi:hypothetical protein